jgi:hypothetical protein
MADEQVKADPYLVEQVRLRGKLIEACDEYRWRLSLLRKQEEQLPAQIAATRACIWDLEEQINALLVQDK